MALLKFYKVVELPEVLDTDAFYFVENSDYAESYLTDNAGNAKKIGNSEMINELIGETGGIGSETDPIWSGVSANYRTKLQNDLLYAALSHVHNATDINAGILPIIRGGTGLSTIGTPGQLLRVAADGVTLEYYTPEAVRATVATNADLDTATAALVTVTIDEENNDNKTLYLKEGSTYIRIHTFLEE